MRTWHCIGLALLMGLGVTVATSASTFADRFTFTRPPAPESVVDPKSGRLNIDIVQWSTPADRDRLVAAMTQDGPEITPFRHHARCRRVPRDLFATSRSRSHDASARS